MSNNCFDDFRATFNDDLQELEASLSSEEDTFNKFALLSKIKSIRTTLDVLEKYHEWLAKNG